MTMSSSEEPKAATKLLGPSVSDTDLRIEVKVRSRLFESVPSPMRIGRFVVLEPIGRGGMGMVYAAYDEQLDRKVAVKVLLEDELPGEEERARFQREAQALARLSHPHVVTVHEVGDSEDGQVFLAMEYVYGKSLREWLETEPEWPQVLEAFVQAGRGLNAAHEAGLVHRDLKPANIMRGEDGVVKVLDFGLARVASDELDESVGSAAATLTPSGSFSALSSSLTRTGTVMGTPAYMAPEQLEGGTVDVRSDQYAFCVSLWQGLTGELPFSGATVDELLHERIEGPPRWPDSAPPVPREIVDALSRGLMVEPDDRWPSMEALLEALSREHRGGVGRWLPGLGGAAILGLVGVMTLTRSEDPLPRCTGARQQLAGIWDEARRSEVGAAIMGVGRSYASDVWDRTGRRLDAHADAWVAMHTDACEATAIRGDQSARILDLRMQCLQRAAAELEATVGTLADADVEVVSRAHQLVSELRPLSRCADIDALEAEVEPPRPEDKEVVATARRHLDRARNERLVGRSDNSREALAEAVEVLEGVEYEPIRAVLLHQQGLTLLDEGEHDAAMEVLKQAVEHALPEGQRALALNATLNMMWVVGSVKQDTEAAMLLQPFAVGLLDDDPLMEAGYRRVLGNLLEAQGRYQEAEVELRAAMEASEAARGPEDLGWISMMGSVAPALLAQGKNEEAEEVLRRSLELLEGELGVGHPDALNVRANLARALNEQGEHAEAEAQARQVLSLRLETMGPDHLEIGYTHNLLGITLAEQERYGEAEAELRAAMELMERKLGVDHAEVMAVRNNVGLLLSEQGKHAEAESELRRTLEWRLEALGPEHPEVAAVRGNLARALEGQERYEEAEAELRAALHVNEAAFGLEHRRVAEMRADLARVLLARGQPEDAQ